MVEWMEKASFFFNHSFISNSFKSGDDLNKDVFKPILEASYLTADNAWRYRTILRFFYEQHEKMRHYIFPEEVFTYLKNYEEFKGYTEDMLHQDLASLVKWKNLIARQETGKVKTIEEFKKKRYRYQCSPYTVEIERMVKNLERLGDSFGGSLEKTLFDRLYEVLQSAYKTLEANDYDSVPDENIHRMWEDIFDYFKKLNQNSADYIAYVNSENIEERMMTEAFLSYKDAFTEYLRDFIISLQQTSFKIETLLQEMADETIHRFAGTVTSYQMKIPRLEELAYTYDELFDTHLESWKNLKRWFLGQDGMDSELHMLQDKTNETIRRMTRFVQRLGEKHHNFRSRKKDYLHIAEWFSRLDSLQEAHKLSSVVFGVFHTKHLHTDEKSSENIYRDVWDEPSTTFTIKPRVRQYREKTKPTALQNFQLEKQMMLNEYLAKQEEQENMLKAHMNGNKITFSELPEIDPYLRKILLSWLGKALSQKSNQAKIDSKRVIQVEKLDDNIITLKAKDGSLQMPNYQITITNEG